MEEGEAHKQPQKDEIQEAAYQRVNMAQANNICSK